MKPGDRLGDYEILGELGRGGMGSVYKVRNTISDRIEAMKILLPDLAGRQELVARFLREIKLVASLDHPNIGALRTALTLDGQLVMIMEFVEGTSLDNRIEQGPISAAEALNYIDQALQGLGHAHKQGVVHRDIKPANLMVTAEGVVKVMDFGIAFSGSEHKLTSTGTTLGSLAYMSPEQVTGEAADARSDLYSLGISLYEMVTGQRPFKADSDYAIMAAHVKEAPRPPIELQPGLPAGLNTIILQAIAKEKENRFQSAEAFRAALRNLDSAERTGARTSTVVLTPVTPIPAAARAAGTQVSHPSIGPVPTMAAPPSPKAVPPNVQQPPMPPPAARSGNRGVYMTLGAVLALALLVAAGTYFQSGAARQDQTTGAPATNAKPPASAAVEPPAKTAAEPVATPAGAPSASPSAAPASSPASVVTKQPEPSPVTPAPAEPVKPVEKAAPAPDNSAQLDELETQIDQLTTRALAVDSSLETLRRQQRAAGYDLRADMAAKQESMKLNLSKARQAFEKGDVARGKKYADLTEAALGQLEKFIGR